MAEEKNQDILNTESKSETPATPEVTSASIETHGAEDTVATDVSYQPKYKVDNLSEKKRTTEKKKESAAKSQIKKKKRAKSQVGQAIQFGLILLLAVLVILAVYIRMTNRSKNSARQAEENMSEVATLKLYNMDDDYPKTARDVVKMHCRLLKCIYNEKLTEEACQRSQKCLLLHR